MTRKEIRAALLGATGAVGQRYVSLLSKHPYIRLEVLMGKESEGKLYGEAVHWLFSQAIPDEISQKKVMPATPESAKGCDLVFSALPSEAAVGLEKRFAEAGFNVVSEASAHRMIEEVPLMVPEVNPEHLKLVQEQKRKRGWRGSLVTTPNCTVTGLAIVLKPLLLSFGLTKAIVTTMQAISGAGYPGVPSLLITENVIPYIKDEEEKVSRESSKILGRLEDGKISPFRLQMAVSCNRVPVIDGHTESVYFESTSELSPDKVSSSLEGFIGEPQRLKLPTAPDKPIIVLGEPDRPQPRLDRMAGSVPGMSVVVGRIRQGIDEKSAQLTLLSHNTIRGAAGNAILTAELMKSMGYIG